MVRRANIESSVFIKVLISKINFNLSKEGSIISIGCHQHAVKWSYFIDYSDIWEMF